jgi:superfamily II DNA or RNA helicase
MIETAIEVDVSELVCDKNPEQIKVTYDSNGTLLAISWLYGTEDNGLYQMAKRRGGVWNRSAGGWMFKDPATANDLLNAIVKRNPEWPIIGHPDKPYLPLSGVRISQLPIGDGLNACLVPFPLPNLSDISFSGRAFKLGKGRKYVGLLIGAVEDIQGSVNIMLKQGAKCDLSLSKKWPLVLDTTKLQVKVKGWAVQVQCDLSNPLHYLVAPEQKYKWDGAYPFGTKVAIPWMGSIHTTRKLWPSLKSKILNAGLHWEGDDAEAEISVPVSFNPIKVSGWFLPAPNGHLMHAYQKKGVEFCVSRGMRVLIGDEMGVGKTVQAIAAAEACSSPRILIICPANARYVWDSEIRGWGGRGGIQHITSQLDKLDMSARWHIVTYDLLGARVQTWRFKDKQEELHFLETFPELAEKIERNAGGRSKITLEESLEKVPAFDSKRLAAWANMMQRLRGELMDQILALGPLLTILDEAHRAKNKTSKRTKAIRRIAAGETQMLMLTGTPLRNNEHEAAALLSLLDVDAADVLSKAKGYTIQDVKDYLEYFMIRRTKAEVLPELPDKTRQRIDIGDLNIEQMNAYHDAMNQALEKYVDVIKRNGSEVEARQSMQGGIERARTALGLAKVMGGGVSDLILDVVENKECCVVFCAHHDVSDSLRSQLELEKLRVAVVDGRTSQKERASIVKAFQDGELDVFIGGIHAAGEAITLTRADTVIFVELDWVPAALLQAEDRIHRVGQRKNCQVIQLIARTPDENNLDEMMVDLIGSKVARIGEVLNEDTSNIISGSIQSQLHERILAGFEKRDVPDDINLHANIRNSGQDPMVPEFPKATPKDEKRKPGRPKIYIDEAPPTAAERSKQSIKELSNAVGKRIMLRLTPEAVDALKLIMQLTGTEQETAAINKALIEQKNKLLKHTQK